MWQIVDERDFDQAAPLHPIAEVPIGDVAEARYMLASAAELTRRPVVLCEVTATIVPNIQPMHAQEAHAERAKRERAFRSGKRKLRL